MPHKYTFFATCPKNIENLLENELLSLGATETKLTIAGVKFTGDLELAYRVCLWSRLANRVLLVIKNFKITTADDLYHSVLSIDWLEHMTAENTFLIDFRGESDEIKNTHFGALKVKDAIVDYFREKADIRPNVDKENPDIRINVYLHHDKATISLDLSGESLHRRGYRSVQGFAPLKENLAAAILYRAGWLEIALQGKPLLDPMCGSGTILIEAVMMAADIAPGLQHENFGFLAWKQHDTELWYKLLEEANNRKEIGLRNIKEKKIEIRGYDVSSKMVKIAQENIIEAGFEKYVSVVGKPLAKLVPPTHHGNQYGLIVTNPPYGERLGDAQEAKELYKTFGMVLKEHFAGWSVAMLVSNINLAKNIGLYPHKKYSFYNGAILCTLLLFNLYND